MRRMLIGVLTVSILLSIVGCGSSKSSFPESAGYLPTRIEKISEGGVVPEGHEAKAQLEEAEYPLESFWGQWVRKDYQEENGTEEKKTASHTFEATAESLIYDGVTNDLTVDLFPTEFGFYPTAHNRWDMDLLIPEYTTSIEAGNTSRKEMETETDGSSVDKAMDNQKLGHGVMTFPVVSAREKGKETVGFWSEISRSVAYQVSGSTLAVGVTDIDQSAMMTSGSADVDVEELSMSEIDYEIAWGGKELILTFDGEAVTYIPASMEENDYGMLFKDSYLEGYQPMDGILGIDYSEGNGSIMRDVHDGYQDAAISFQSDGVVSIDGKQYEFRRSEKTLTLISGNDISLYSDYQKADSSSNHSVSQTIWIDGQEIDLDPDDLSVETFMNNGFSCDIDLTQMIQQGEVTGEFALYTGNSILPVKAVNPYDNAVPLGMCSIAYFRIDEHSDSINKGDGATIGSTKRDEIEFYYESAYERKTDSLRYKAHQTSFRMIRTFDDTLASRGNTILDLNGDVEVIYEFDGDILKDILIERPALLYNGLQDNLDREQLVDMNAATMSGVIQARDTVLDRLKDAFNKANISVRIEESTGEVVMDDSVLFGYDSADLSDEGKKYLDNLMSTYAPVVLSDEFQNSIAEIRFEGHTDSSGSYEYNLDLSQRRAEAVRDYCLNESSLSETEKLRLRERGKAIGYGFSDLVYNDRGEEDPDASRRVAIKFFMAVEGE